MNPLSLILGLIGAAIGEVLSENAKANAAAAKPVEATVVDAPPATPVARAELEAEEARQRAAAAKGGAA